MHTVKNTSDGPRFFFSGTGIVHLQPGETSEPVEISDADREAMSAAGHFAIDGEGGDKGLAGMTVPDLKALAEAEEIDLGDATKKADIIAAIELAREAKA